MIEIEYFGGNSLKITNGNEQIVINPKREKFGLKNLNVENQIEMISDNTLSTEDGNPKLVINSPGEYEVGVFSIKGYAIDGHTDFNNEKNITNYSVTTDGVSIIIFGNSTDKIEESHYENLGLADILMLPVGGNGFTLDGKAAAKIVGQIEPKIVIPVCYSDGNSYEVDLSDETEFVNAIGKDIIELDKLKIKNLNDLSESGQLNIVKLKSQK